jgi:hypothetical protein
LSYSVATGWMLFEDQPGSFMLHTTTVGTSGAVDGELFVSALAAPAMVAVEPDGRDCGDTREAVGVDAGVDGLVAAIRQRPGLVSTTPTRMTIGGREATLLDLRMDPDWTRGCIGPGGRVLMIPILQVAGMSPSPVFGIGPDAPVRLILVDLGDDQVMAIGIVGFGPDAASTSELIEVGTEIARSFQFE